MKNQTSRDLARNYEKSVRWSSEDECYVGHIAGLVGDCCHGDDPILVFRECEEIALECVVEALAIGKPLPAPVPVAPQHVNVPALRASLGLTQVAFAKTLGISAKTLHKWEHGVNRPSGSARSLLRLTAAAPRFVREILQSNPR